MTTAYRTDHRRPGAGLGPLLAASLVLGCGRCNYDSFAPSGSSPDGAAADAQPADGAAGDGSRSDGAGDARDGSRDGQAGGSSSVLFVAGNVVPWGLGVDSAGNLYLGGSYGETVDFGDGPRTSGGGTDFFVASYTAALDLRWVLTGQTTGHANVRDIAVGTDGTVFATGLMAGTTANLGSPIDAGAQQDVLLFSLDSAGGVRWADHWEGDMINNHQGREIELAEDGSVLAAGTYVSAIDFGTGALPTGSDSGFATAFDDGPSARWSVPFLGFEVFPNGLAIGPGGGVFVGGRFVSTIDFDDGRDPYDVRGPADVFVAGLDANGSLTWGRTYGGDGTDTLHDMTLKVEDLVLVGQTEGDLDFGFGVDPGRGQTDAILLRLDRATGDVTAAHRYGGTGQEVLTRVASGPVLVAGGAFDAPFQLGGDELAPAGHRDVCVMAVSSEGDPTAVVQLGGPADEQLRDIAWDPAGNRWLVALDYGEGDTRVLGETAAGPGMAVAGFTL